MKFSDFEIHSIKKLDNILIECCRLVLGKQRDDDYWGMVGACIVDQDNNLVFGVNHLVDDTLRDHAEVVAIKNYIKKYGEKGLKNSIIITTLSPCSSDIDQPDKRNCTEYLNDFEIKKVYCGYVDPYQSQTETYSHKHFHVQETRNKKIHDICRMMAETFL